MMRAMVMTVVLMLVVGCSSSRVERGDRGTQAVLMVGQTSGNAPALRQAGVWLINSQQEVAATGSEQLEQLNVDFDSHSLVLVALGEKPTGGYWAQITGVQKKDDALFVQAVVNRPGPEQMVTQALTYPFAAAVVQKVEASTLHPEVQSVEGRPMP